MFVSSHAQHSEWAPVNPDLFDRAEALTRVCGNLALLRELAELFLEDSPRWLGDIRSALRSGDAAALRRAAHTLRGSVGSLGSRLAEQAAGQLESLAHAGDLAISRESFCVLEGVMAELWIVLSELVEGRGSALSDPTPLPWRRPQIQEPAP